MFLELTCFIISTFHSYKSDSLFLLSFASATCSMYFQKAFKVTTLKLVVMQDLNACWKITGIPLHSHAAQVANTQQSLLSLQHWESQFEVLKSTVWTYSFCLSFKASTAQLVSGCTKTAPLILLTHVLGQVRICAEVASEANKYNQLFQILNCE